MRARGGRRRHDPPGDIHAHEQRKRPGGYIVRREDRTAGRRTHFGIALRFEKLGRKSPVRLGRRYQVLVRRHSDFDAVLVEKVREAGGRHGVALLARDAPVFVGMARRDLRVRHLRRAAHEVTRMVAYHLQHRVGRDELVVHDVAQPPDAAGPRAGEVARHPVLGESLAAGRELVAVELDGRGHARGGELDDQSEDVLELRIAVHRAGVVRVEDVLRNHAGLSGLLEAPRHVASDEIDPAPHERIHRGSDRVGVRRHEHARPAGSHLVNVEPDLREPFFVRGPRHRLRFLLREHVPVAVVVVTRVVVVEPRHAAALVRRPHPLPVPLGLHYLPIRIERWNQEEDDVPEPALGVRVGSRHDLVGELHHHLRRRDLARVDVVREEDDRLPFARERIHLRRGKPARIRQRAGYALVALPIAQVLRGGDHREHEVVAVRRDPDLRELHPRRAGGESFEVRDDLVVVRQRAVRADLEAEEFRGSGELRGRRGLRRRCRRDGDREKVGAGESESHV